MLLIKMLLQVLITELPKIRPVNTQLHLVQQQFPHPSREGRPGGNTVTQVSHDPDHDDGRTQVVDFSLETQTKPVQSEELLPRT